MSPRNVAKLMLLTAAVGGALLAQAAPNRVEKILEVADHRAAIQTDVWFEDGDYPQIIQLLRYRAELYPHDYEVHTDLAWMLGNVQETAEQIAVFRRYAKWNPQDPDATYPEAEYYYLRREYAKVPPLLEEACKRTPPPHPNAFRALARSYEKLDKLEDSARVWHAYLKLNPSDVPAQNNLKRVEAKLKVGNGNKPN